MMGRVRSSRSTSRGVEVARRLQPTLGAGPNVRVRNLKPISVLPYLRRPTMVETSKGDDSIINLKRRGCEPNLRGAYPVGRDEGDSSYVAPASS